MLIIQGQWDALVLASLTIGWIGVQRKNPWLLGFALVGITTKFTNVIIPTLVLLYGVRSWPIKKLLRVTIIPLITLGISFLIAGWDWPIRYSQLLKLTLTYFQQIQVTTLFSKTLYPISYRLILPPFGLVLVILLTVVTLYLLFRVIRQGVNLDTMNLALALNLVISPYITFHHVIYLAPLQASLIKKNRAWGLGLVGVAILDIILMWLGVGLIIYPIAAILILSIITIGGLRRLDPNASVGIENSS